MTFFFPHDAKEKIVYEKTNQQIELILNYPERDRIVNQNSEPIVVLALFLPMMIVLPILFFIVSAIRPNANLLKFGLPIWVVLGAGLLFILKGCIQGKRQRKKESQMFNATELSARLYPYIRLTEQELFSKLQLQVEHFGKMAITSSNIKAVEKCIEKFFRGLIAKPLTRATIQFIGKMQHIVRTIVFNRNTFGDVLA